MSRNWQRVAKNIQKLAAGMYAVKSEGSFPYETHYVLALGLRFNVFALLPATILALLCTGVVGAIVAASVVSIFFAMLYVCAALQIGYSFSLLIWLGILYLLPEHRRNSNLPDIGLQHRPAGGPQIRRELIYPYPSHALQNPAQILLRPRH